MAVKHFSIQNELDWLEKRKGYITSTESAALFGLQMASAPTAYELWHIKRGEIDSNVKENNYMQWGRILQDAVCEIIKQDNPDWGVRPLQTFAYNDDIKMGSSFDNIVETPERGIGVLEIKTTSYRDWKSKFVEDDDGEFIECPPYYEVQGQHQLHLLGTYDYVCFAVAILDTREVKYIFRERDRGMGDSIEKKVQEFWNSKQPPKPDLEKDSDLLARMQRANSSDKSIDLTEHKDFDAYAYVYNTANENIKRYTAEKKVARSQMILALEDANTGYSNEFKVSNKSSFRLTPTKGK